MYLYGERINIRPLNFNDAESLFKYSSNPELYVHSIVVHRPASIYDSKDYIISTLNKLGHVETCELGIELKETKEIIGICGLSYIDKENLAGEISYWLGLEHWGKGFATESVKLFLEYAFEKLNLHRVYAKVFVENAASRNVLEKCGFKYEGTLRDDVKRDGMYYTNALYSILSREYIK